MTTLRIFLLVIGAGLASAHSGDCIYAQGISRQDAGLKRHHGPWMIHVATLSSAKDSERANRTAALLVTELCAKGLPAYSVSRSIKLQGKGLPSAQTETVVLAGNYESSTSSIAQRTLEYIRQLKETPTAKQLAKSAGETAPFKDAFIRRNPLIEAIAIGQPEK